MQQNKNPVSEREKNAETRKDAAIEALRKSEERMRAIIDNSPFGAHSYELFADGRLILVGANKSADAILGIDHSLLIGNSIEAAFPSLGYTDIPAKYKRVAANGRELHEDHVNYSDGKIIGAYEIYAFQTGQNRMSVFFHDISERKRSEEALQENERKYRRIVNTSNEGIMSVNERHVVDFVNNRMADMLGYQPEEIIGKPYLFFLFNEDIPDYKAKIIMRIRGHSERYECRMRSKDGSPIWTIISATPLLDAQNRFMGSFGMFTDITERKKTEESLRENEEKYRTLIDNMHDAVYRCNLNGIITFASPSAIRILGCRSLDSVIGMNIGKDFYYHPEDREKFLKAMNDKGKLTRFEVTLKRQDNGKPVNVLTNSQFYYDRNGTIIGIEGVFSDITEWKKMETERTRLEEMLLHSQKIESIGRLAGGIAHDFNNLLTAILGYTELTMHQLDPAGKLYSQLSVVMKAAQGAVNLTKQLLAFSRKQVIEPEIINLNSIIERVHKMILTLVGENIKLNIVPRHDLFTIKADPGQIEQIIINLAANARDAMPDGGELVIETANVYFNENYCSEHADLLPGDYVMMSITDTGTGMSKDILDHIFEPFFTTKEKGRGTGLGLATVYGIVKQNIGTIEVYSETGRGTVFKLYFPRSLQIASQALKPQTKPDMPTGTETILITEDKAQVLEFSREILTRLGYKVLTAASGEEALIIAENYKDKIHMLMTDVILPGINGRVTAERLLLMRPELKILYNSGYTAEIIDKQGMLEQGINFISKPFTTQELSFKVRTVLDKN